MKITNPRAYEPGGVAEFLCALPPKLTAQPRLAAVVLFSLAKEWPVGQTITELDLRKITRLTAIGLSNSLGALRKNKVLVEDGWFYSPWLADGKARLVQVVRR